MDYKEAIDAFENETSPIMVKHILMDDIECDKITALIYRKRNGKKILQVEVSEKGKNSVHIMRPSDVYIKE